MKKGKILIVEDNKITAKHLATTLQKFDYEVTGCVDSLENVKSSIVKSCPDLVILDINLGGDFDGVQIAQVLRLEFEIPYLFLTSLNDQETINRIIQAQPFGYIVKPFDTDNLQAVVDLAIYKAKRRNDLMSIDSNHTVNKSDLDELKNYIFVKNGSNIDRVFIPNIEFVEADGRYTYIHFQGQKKISNAPLKVLKEKLQGRHFIQTHRSYIVNVTKVDTITFNYLNVGKHEVPIGKTYRSDLLNGLEVI
ncbi:LytR/AlgR family response regulator transcription factor [Fulvivirga lutimaris]|uniref:LytR/AlgR family response regulator transcription factor n=1 Tax=Fulvivirga lutimaris TaxID=1819566 RepID=UPI0012BD542A|nr:response regulator [Fulvivirga lutimaris]MTI40898.1 response regulator transcription factor [Fulvivirga lutimaris]